MRGLRRIGPYPPFASLESLHDLAGSPSDRGMPRLRKNGIQSWVLIHPFSANSGPRNGQEMAICQTKKADFYSSLKLQSSAIQKWRFRALSEKFRISDVQFPELPKPNFGGLELWFSRVKIPIFSNLSESIQIAPNRSVRA